MKKEYFKQYTIGDDHLLKDNWLGFCLAPKTYTVRLLPEFQYKKAINRKSCMRKIWESFIKGLR